jgi:multiple sugar transport system substrate-binding protein
MSKGTALAKGSQRIARRAFLKRAAGLGGLILLSAACGGAPQTGSVATPAADNSAPAATVAVAATALPVKEPVTIRFSSVGWGGWLAEPWTLLVERFNESQSAVQIPGGYEDISEGYEKVLAQAAGGVGADVYLFETKQMQSFAARDFFRPLGDYVSTSGVVKQDAYFATDWKEMFWNGQQYLVPFDNSPAMLWYNKDLFDQAGVKYPPNQYGVWTWEDFLGTAKQLTSGSGPSRVFGWAGERGWVYLLNWIWSNGGMLLNDQKTECLIDSPESIAALQWAADLVHEHKVQPQAAELGEGGNSGLFFGKRAAMAQKGTWWAIDLKAQEGLNWNVAPMPDGPAGAFVRNPLDAWGIWSGSKNPDAAWQFIEFLSKDESLNELTKAGLSVSKRSVMQSEVFLKQEPTTVDWRLFVEALDGHTKPHPDTAIYPEMSNLLQSEWDAVLDGASSVEAMVKKVKDPINQLLAECMEKGNCVAVN